MRRWIAEGAPYAAHWSFVRPTRPPVPAVANTQWPRNPIDHFVLQTLEARNLPPNPPADKYALLRRVSLDLRGLPPTPDEVRALAADSDPTAYEKMVDQFLDDPAYGERWARVWLDLARYADSRGYGSDPLRTNMWRYRDWVIESFNRNLPYDQFTVEQLAGDLLPNPTLEQRMATAFHRNTMTNTEGGTDDEEFRIEAVKDRVDTTIQVWMGLTMGCAKCHDHKYDPLTQREYYQLFAVFNQTQDKDLPDESPTLEVPRAEDFAALDQHAQKVAALEQQLADVQKQLVEQPPPAPRHRCPDDLCGSSCPGLRESSRWQKSRSFGASRPSQPALRRRNRRRITKGPPRVPSTATRMATTSRRTRRPIRGRKTIRGGKRTWGMRECRTHRRLEPHGQRQPRAVGRVPGQTAGCQPPGRVGEPVR